MDEAADLRIECDGWLRLALIPVPFFPDPEGKPDGNVDLRLRCGDEQRLVQCKQWQARSVGVEEVRKLAGTLLREGLHGRAGVLITSSSFTSTAIDEAKRLRMGLIDGRDLSVVSDLREQPRVRQHFTGSPGIIVGDGARTRVRFCASERASPICHNALTIPRDLGIPTAKQRNEREWVAQLSDAQNPGLCGAIDPNANDALTGESPQ
ncbi:MAG: restriction endonuclease [Solirubrobacteraceae bacterium]